MCFHMWIWRVPFWVKARGHTVHLYGFSPVCILIWRPNWLGFWKDFEHILHLYIVLWLVPFFLCFTIFVWGKSVKLYKIYFWNLFINASFPVTVFDCSKDKFQFIPFSLSHSGSVVFVKLFFEFFSLTFAKLELGIIFSVFDTEFQENL